jgi:thiol:disulfide interchange protein DsbD
MITRLPKAGMWMIWIRKFFGILLVGVALYFLIPQAKQIQDQTGFYLGVLAMFGGLLLGFLDQDPGYTKAFKILRSVMGVSIIVLGVGMVNGALHSHEERVDWITYEEGILTDLREKNTPLLLDFYADWCTACKELDARTFSDDDVADLAKKFAMVRVDCTAPSPPLRKVMKEFNVSGLPTVVFVSTGGKELRDLRVTGFVEPDDMESRMRKALSPPAPAKRSHKGHGPSRGRHGKR